MKINLLIFKAAVIFLLIALFFSCSAEQEFQIDLNGRGQGSADIKLQPVLTSYLTDLSMVMSDDPDAVPAIFDENAIRILFWRIRR